MTEETKAAEAAAPEVAAAEAAPVAAPEKVGTQNLTEVVDAVLDVVDLGKLVGADGKVDLADLGHVVGAAPKLVGSVSAAVKDVALVIPEAKDLDAQEFAALGAHVVTRLALGENQKKAEAIVVASLKIAGGVVELGRAIAS